jgi:large subunit ribosomal protein L9
MQVILLERVEKLGQMGDEVTVKNGYARNFLLPQKKALRATNSNRAFFENEKARLEAENLERKKDAEAAAGKLDGAKCILIRSAGESGQLYGSVTSRDIVGSLAEAGTTINRNQVVLDRAIKTLGLHDITIRLHPEVAVTVVINIARSADEAEMQFETGGALVKEDDFESDFESSFGDEDEDEAEGVASASAAEEVSEEEKTEE